MEAMPGILKRIFMNPVTLREVRQACRSWKLVAFLSVYLLIQASIFTTWIYASSQGDTFQDPTSIGRDLFTTMSVVLVIVVMLVFPAFSSAAIASEHEKKSFDLLVLTPLAPWEIALGKFFAAAIQASVFLIATVPLFAMANLFGGIAPEVFFLVLWVLVLFSVLISFLGVYASSLVTRSIPAVLVTYLFSMLFGLLLLTVFIVLSLGISRSMAMASLPLIGFFTDPTLLEGAFYVATMTVTCGMYCALLFLSTTNRLKPTSHNKSTNLRLLWLAVALVVPAQLAAYFLIARLPSYTTVYGTLITAVLYLGMLMLVPALAFPAEPPIASRRVRREMEKAPSGLLRAGGALLFPGGHRGMAYVALIATLAFALLWGASTLSFNAMQERSSDLTLLAADYHSARLSRGVISPSDPAAAPVSTTPSPSIGMLSPDEMRSALEIVHDWDLRGIGMICLAVLVTVLVIGQTTWRLSLSGLSRGVCSVLAVLVLGAWLILPFIASGLIEKNADIHSSNLAQFSPAAAMAVASQYAETGITMATGSPLPKPRAEALQARKSELEVRYLAFLVSALTVGALLCVLNVLSQRGVNRAFKAATMGTPAISGSGEPQAAVAPGPV